MNRKLSPVKLILIIVALLVIVTSIPAFRVFALFDKSDYEITGLTARQDGFNMALSWDAEDCAKYDVRVFKGIKQQRRAYFTNNKGHLNNVEIGKTYRIMVAAVGSDGKSSGAQLVKFMPDKLKQEIKLSSESLSGFKGDTAKLEAEGKGDITFSSKNESIATVGEDGSINFKKSGKTLVSVHAAGNDEYKDTTSEVEVLSYPDSLPKTKAKISDKRDTSVSLTWNPIDFATGYTVMKLNPATDKYEKYKTLDAKETCLKLTRDQATYKVFAHATVNDKSVRGETCEAVTVESTAKTANTYRSSHNIMTLNSSNLETLAALSRVGSTDVPQSMSFDGDDYTIAYVNHSGTAGKLVTYNRNGKMTRAKEVNGIGHANGSTYNPNTGNIYVVKTHQNIKSKSCSVFTDKDIKSQGTFNLPKVTSGIAYDTCNDKYYLSKGNEIYVTDSKFAVEKFFRKKIRYNHAQDVGAYNGVVLVCTWVSGDTSYIDMYRTSDGAYLGSYYLPIGEVESCVVDDGYLIILMNKRGTSKDFIYKTKERIAIP